MWQCIHVAFELFFFLFLDYVYARSSIGICSTSHKSQVAATDYSVGTRHNNMADKMQPRQFFPGTEGGTTIQYMFRISVDSFSQQRKGEKSNHKVESCVCVYNLCPFNCGPCEMLGWRLYKWQLGGCFGTWCKGGFQKSPTKKVE